MKHSCCTVIALYLFLAVHGTVAQDRGPGFGAIIGGPTGISAKLWTSEYTVFDFVIGWSIGWDQIWKFKENYNGGRWHPKR